MPNLQYDQNPGKKELPKVVQQINKHYNKVNSVGVVIAITIAWHEWEDTRKHREFLFMH